MKNSVGIVILNVNDAVNTVECIESITKMNFKNYEIILVDNGSTDNSAYIIKQKFPKITLIKNKRNLGFAEGNNVGIRHAIYEKKVDWVLLLNNDTIVDPNFLIELLNAAQRDRNIGVLGPKIYFLNSPRIWFAGGKINWFTGLAYNIRKDKTDNGKFCEIKDVDYITGCAFMIKKEVIERVGLLDPDYFIYFEDADFCIRARRKGFRVVFVPKSKIWHKVSGFTKGASPLGLYLNMRNNIIFMRKNNKNVMTWFSFGIFFIFRVLKWFFVILLKQRKKMLRKMLAILWGINDGLLNINVNIRIDKLL